MATTTNFGWETPDDTDLVKDGALAMRTLGNSIDTSFVDLKGGTTGQILSKASNTDMDFTWIANDQGDITAVTAGTGISGGGSSGAVTITNDMATTITASGDIIVGTGSGTYDNLPIGTTGQVLTADTTVSPYKVKWATPASGSTYAGVFLTNSNSTLSISNATATAVTWDQEEFDTNGFHSTVSNTSRITIPTGKDGYYNIQASTAWASNNSGERLIFLYKNGSKYFTNFTASDDVSVSNVFTATMNLAAGDYIEMYVFQDSGGNLNARLRSGTEIFAFFGATYLGA